MTTPTIDITEWHINQSNLIEGVTSPLEVEQSMMAWHLIRDHPGPLTAELILVLHNAIMLNQLPGRLGGRGSFRIRNVTVGGRTCPHWNEVPALVDEWLAIYQDCSPRGAHVEFEHIHPFIDGNGRTGRMLMWWHEIKLGNQPTLITYDGRWKYYSWFNNNWQTHSAKSED